MEKIEYFDYQKVAKEMNVPDTTLKKIEKEVKEEFPKDKMMFELHAFNKFIKKLDRIFLELFIQTTSYHRSINIDS